MFISLGDSFRGWGRPDLQERLHRAAGAADGQCVVGSAAGVVPGVVRRPRGGALLSQELVDIVCAAALLLEYWGSRPEHCVPCTNTTADGR